MDTVSQIESRLADLEKVVYHGTDEPQSAIPAKSVVQVVEHEATRIRRNLELLDKELKSLAAKWDFVTAIRIGLYDFEVQVEDQFYSIDYSPLIGYEIKVVGGWFATFPNQQRLMQELAARIAKCVVENEYEKVKRA